MLKKYMEIRRYGKILSDTNIKNSKGFWRKMTIFYNGKIYLVTLLNGKVIYLK